ncbi:MAG: hypothetical protein Q7S74_01050 [Nanoarchaeota archaeon]|nr:hypothetical protein [Nanoarchaeota archaeon]
MRKIILKENLERKRKRNVTLASIFLFAILILSTVGFALFSADQSAQPQTPTNSSGITDLGGGRWGIALGDKSIVLSNSLATVKDIPVEISTNLISYTQSPIYISSKNDAIAREIANALSSYANRIQNACYGQCEENLPEKTCSDNLIVWVDKTENKVYQKDNCIFIEGDMRAVDAFIYHLLGFS